ncbi:hypothetical protein TREMEDRAFT_26050 [Tremella mesenterica DSM 1558]|uniref:uncharacterized protein n=1 Tax=Tremella mesenterica (strain ATCC 24925 / CBS 8224 / DSM 1558 / NBRC 9311 / NRRL Y-6157 / RJB 2259-6 / UBC 559-6) TaxID=578456 RepID=UPI0003F48DD2|nr:uncharacterized protein TREMEDRAFT_26050 [Tremella mesenterica DSM 1558]EIW72535.1 hypothetical protein TREMEDRAFT_26050 [Tremella mesenterica DSM 1558]
MAASPPSPPRPKSAIPPSVPKQADERAPLLGASQEPGASYDSNSGHDETNGSSRHYNLAGLSQRSFWILICSMLTSVFLAAFDGTIVSTLLGPISSSFKATNLASWLGTSYLLSVCCFTPIYGRLCNIIGRQASMLLALGLFSIGNIGCGFAPNMGALITARAIAGMGGGGLQSVGSTIFSDLVPVSHRGLFQGYGNIVFGLGTGLGAPLGGFINDALGWRWAFFVQLPIMLTAIFLIFWKVRYKIQTDEEPSKGETSREKIARVDFLGSLTLAGFVGAALVAVSLPTSSTEDFYKWTDPLVLGLFATSFVLLICFIFVEKKAAEPVLPLELLTSRTPISVAINNFLLSIIAFSVIYSVPLYFTAVILMSPTSAGQHLIPNSFCAASSSLIVGMVVKRTHRYYWLTFSLGILGVLGSISLASWKDQVPEWMLWINVAPLTFAAGGVSTATIVALIADVGRENVAIATSLSYVFRTTGQVLGVALSGALTQSILTKELNSRITGPDASELIKHIRQSSQSVRDLPPNLQIIAQQSYASGLHAVFVTTIVTSVLAVIVALGMREVKMDGLPKNQDQEGEEV